MDFTYILFILLMFINYVAGDLLQVSSVPINMTRVLRSITGITITGCYMECARENGCQSIAITEGAPNQLPTCYLLKEDNGHYEGGENVLTTIREIGTGPTVHGQWGCWTNSSSCNASCGGGHLNQSRKCDSPKPQHGGDNCTGLSHRTIRCNTHSCPVPGNWGAWNITSVCNDQCNGGFFTKTRDCIGGDVCAGDKVISLPCSKNDCPVVNIALNKPATQLGLYTTSFEYRASDGNDGSENTYSITSYTSSPWWEVDLQADVEIEYFVLRVFRGNREDVSVFGKNATAISYQTCKDRVNLKTGVVRFSCDSNLKFRFIRIARKGVTGYLYINEFEVYVRKS